MVEDSRDMHRRDFRSVTDSCLLHEQASCLWMLLPEPLGDEILERRRLHGLILEMPSVRRVK